MYVYKKEVEKEEIIDSLGNGEREKALRFLLSVSLSLFSTFHIFFCSLFSFNRVSMHWGMADAAPRYFFCFIFGLSGREKDKKGKKEELEVSESISFLSPRSLSSSPSNLVVVVSGPDLAFSKKKLHVFQRVEFPYSENVSSHSQISTYAAAAAV